MLDIGAAVVVLASLAAAVFLARVWVHDVLAAWRRRGGGGGVRSRIFIGSTVHSRFQPVQHTFTYPVLYFCLDLDELPILERRFPLLFGYNKWRLFGLCDEDYMGRRQAPVRDKLEAFLRAQGVHERFERIELVTMPRCFGMAFNPVSFYYCYGADGEIRLIVSEVNNTFGETFVYTLDARAAAVALGQRKGYLSSYRVERAFHVSPFNDRQGDYEIHCADIRERLDIVFVIYKDGGRKHLFAKLSGKPSPLDVAGMLYLLLAHPITVLLTTPRIMYEAGKLAFRKKLPVYTKPDPIKTTVGTLEPSPREQRGIVLLGEQLMRQAPAVRFRLPTFEPRELVLGATSLAPPVQMHLRNYSLFEALGSHRGWEAVACTYADASWDCDDLPAFLEQLLSSRFDLYAPVKSSALLRLVEPLRMRSAGAATGLALPSTPAPVYPADLKYQLETPAIVVPSEDEAIVCLVDAALGGESDAIPRKQVVLLLGGTNGEHEALKAEYRRRRVHAVVGALYQDRVFHLPEQTGDSFVLGSITELKNVAIDVIIVLSPTLQPADEAPLDMAAHFPHGTRVVRRVLTVDPRTPASAWSTLDVLAVDRLPSARDRALSYLATALFEDATDAAGRMYLSAITNYVRSPYLKRQRHNAKLPAIRDALVRSGLALETSQASGRWKQTRHVPALVARRLDDALATARAASKSPALSDDHAEQTRLYEFYVALMLAHARRGLLQWQLHELCWS